MLDYNRVLKAIDKNMVVFDKDATPGDFTLRLVSFLSAALWNHHWGSLKHIFVQRKDSNIYERNIPLSDDEYIKLIQFYEENNASMAPNKTNLCIAESIDGEYLLGCY